MSKYSYYTEEGLKKLRDELDHLKMVERPRISQQIAEARDKGDLSENADLKTLICKNNLLTSLNVSSNKALEVLDCHKNELSILDVSNNKSLMKLDIHNNQFQTIDVSENTNLTEFICHTNDLVSLDLSKNNELTDLDCRKNPLTCIQVNNTQFNNVPASWEKEDTANYSLTPCL